MKEGKRWIIVVLYAVAMAWMESAVVFYLRSLGERVDPAQAQALPQLPGLASTEAVREAATLLMIWAVGMLAGRTWRGKWGYAAIAFGVWDIFYYVFLKVILGWPHSLSNWDVLFLLPLPWWGPVLSPVLIAFMMILWGTLASQGEPFDHPFRSEWKAWALNFSGMAVALYVFMEHALHEGVEAALTAPPARFNWPLFLFALGLMAAPIVHTSLRLRARKLVTLQASPIT